MIAEPATFSFPALGSTAVVVAERAEGLHAATKAVERELDRIDLACSRFRSDSDLSRVNDGSGRWVPVSELFLTALDAALLAANATDGAVDPTVGEALVRIGYDRDFAKVPATGRRVGEPGPAPDWTMVEVDADRSGVRVPTNVRMDLGATAKALAADRAVARAADAAGCGVMVGLGGDVSATGTPPAGGWTIGFADDHAGRAELGQTIAIEGGGVATSSTRVRRWSRGGVPMHHVIDPRTGWPAPEVWRSVSVTAATCVDANTATTAAIVWGEDAPAWLDARRLPARLVRPDGTIVRVSGWPEGNTA